MASTTVLTLVDGVRVVVPDSLNLMTPYVLREQQDWFEDEIKFLRLLLRPGGKVIDIGANYGVYTLSMAQAVGPAGAVWAFEPASSTASLLAESIAVNQFSQVTLDRSALSSTRGSAQFSSSQDSELNALVRDPLSVGASETVPVTTLDDCLEKYGWEQIEFLKLDAEEEEANILKGGTRFFAELSPLVQYEVKAGGGFHLELVELFAALGYESYRLVPGLNLLVKFDAGSSPDDYLLNVFCCKPDRAAQLAAGGFLLQADAGVLSTAIERHRPILDTFRNHAEYDWRQTIAKLPYGAMHSRIWNRTAGTNQRADLDAALFFYAVSHDSHLSAAERFATLETSHLLFQLLCEQHPTHLRWASQARVARDYGARAVAANALVKMSKRLIEEQKIDPSEPFLAPGETFDNIVPGQNVGNWVLAAVLDQLERIATFSSYYTGDLDRPRLEMIRDSGFGSSDMLRRLSLLDERYGVPSAG